MPKTNFELLFWNGLHRLRNLELYIIKEKKNSFIYNNKKQWNLMVRWNSLKKKFGVKNIEIRRSENKFHQEKLYKLSKSERHRPRE